MKIKEKKIKPQPGPSTSTSGTRLPPVVEWLTFTMKQLKTTSNLFIQELEGVLSEWVDKNLDELLKEEYQASRITERVVKEFHHITTKTVATLQEQDQQTKKELKARFPWIEKHGIDLDDDDLDLDKKVNGTSTVSETKEDEETVILSSTATSKSTEDVPESESVETPADASPNKRKGKGKKGEDASSTQSKDCSHDEAKDADEEPDPDGADTGLSKRLLRKKKSNTDAVSRSEEELLLSDDADGLPSRQSPVPRDEDENSNSSSAGKGDSENISKDKDKVLDNGSCDAEDVDLNDSMDAETEVSSNDDPLDTSTADLEKQEKSKENVEESVEDEVDKDQEVEEGDKNNKISGNEQKKSDNEESDSETNQNHDQRSDDDTLGDPFSPIVLEDSEGNNDSGKESKGVKKSPENRRKDRSCRQSAARAEVLSGFDDDDSQSPPKGSDKKSNKVSAPFKRPKKLAFKNEEVSKKDLTDDDDKSSSDGEGVASPSKDFKLPKEKPKAVDANKAGADENYETEMAWSNDYKLNPAKSYVAMETLSDLILSRLRTHKFVIVKEDDSDKDKKGRKGRRKRQDEPDDALTKALKKLASFSPYVRDSKNRSQSTAKSSKNGKTKSRGAKADDDDLVRYDGTDASSDEEPVLKRSIRPVIPEKLKSRDRNSDEDLVGSDDEDLDGHVFSSDDEDARKSVLKNAKGVKKEPLSEGEDKDSQKPGEKRKKGGNYYTPKVCKMPELDDSENSDDEDFVTTKKRKVAKGKKAVINSDSDGDDSSGGKKKPLKSNYVELSSGSDESDSDRKKPNKKKRRVSSSDSDYQVKKRRKRIRNVSDSDEDTKRKSKKKSKGKKGSDVEILSGSDSDVQEVTEDGGNKGRKKIRGIMNKKDLQSETRRAEEDEEKRKKRLQERQSQFNVLFKAPETATVDKLVLDYDPENKEPLVELDTSIAKKLKPHQVKGISFMFNACFESVEEFKKPNSQGSGCILAHCMGLGKTLQTIAFLHSVMTNELLKIKMVLIMCPLNTVGNWSNELKIWLREAKEKIYVHALYDEKNVPSRVQALQTWKRRGGVGIIHYDAFRALVEGKKIKKNHKTVISECLLDPGPDLVICDEGHVFKNDKSKISVAVNKIRTLRRVVLTGTPLQNNLLEYHCMMQFVKPNLLGSKKEFSNRFVNPITNGQHKDSTSQDVSVMKKRSHVLHKLLDGCVQRLDYSVLLPYLPPKYEYVVLINMTEIQKTLYTHYLNSIKEHTSVQDLIKGGLLLKHSANLAKVWCHPYALSLKHNENNAISTGSESLGSMDDFIDDRSDDTPDSDSDIDWLDEHSRVMKKKKDKEKDEEPVKVENENSNPLPDTEQLSGDLINNGGDWWSKFFKSKGDIQFLEHSSKMMVLMDIIKTCEGIQDKVLVFSQYLYSLNMIEEFLDTLDEEAKKTDVPDSFPCFPKVTDYSQRWRKNIEYFRIDGSTKSADRQKNCDMFNKTELSRAKLFLISTKAGGLGINLVGANRVVIFDASWNPSQDVQSIFRVFRFGQKKPCYIYRLLAKGTIEEKIYNRQVVKLSLSGRVVDEHQIERHFTFDDVAKMYEFDPDEKADRPTPPVPKDRLLADLLMSRKDMIDSYLEHDSLLENQTAEELSEEERKVAWDEYQNEKNNLRMNMNMNPNLVNNAFHNLMNSATQIEIEQAYEKMKGKIREMYPNLTPEEYTRYTSKVQKDVDDLRKFTYQFHERHMAFTDALRKRWIDVLQEKKRCIQTYFTIPGALQMEMMGLLDPYGSAVHGAQRPAQPVLDGPIHVVPLSNIMEPNPSYATPGTSVHYLNPNPRNLATYRPSILNNRVRGAIPTTTVPYNPNIANQPSSYTFSGPSQMN